MRRRYFKLFFSVSLFLMVNSVVVAQQSVARQWDEEILSAIRRDLARPPIQARNLFHVSIAMYDGWAVYDPIARRYLTFESHTAEDIEAARAKTISYAAYRILRQRYANSPGAAQTLASLDARMAALGFNTNINTTMGNSPEAVGNRIAANVINFGLKDGSNQQNNYSPNPPYLPVNDALIVSQPGPGNPNLANPSRWQPLALDFFVDQNGSSIPSGYPSFIGPHWGHVTAFALTPAHEGPPFVYHDPGPPPQFGTNVYKEMFLENLCFSSQLTPDDGVMIDISPGARGNNTLGTNDGHGHKLNPFTGLPYAPNIVKRGDWARVLSEFWADGPSSETPPGHWNVVANYVADYPGFQKRLGGIGLILKDLEWDVKVYFAINAAVHDAAVTAWGAKGFYDSIRPISAIRYMADLGQSSDPAQPSYHPNGLLLEPGVVEVITPSSSAPGQRHEALASFVGEIAVLAWPGAPADPVNQTSGVRWVRAKNWLPYQKTTFVTPPFAGWISGHSTFSRAAAEVMKRLTGTEFFPGGMGVFHARANSFLSFERGPSQDVTMQWATYYDAADEAGLSRLYGGIHPYVDDFAGRTRGALVGIAACNKARILFSGNASCTLLGDVNSDSVVDGEDIAGFARAKTGSPPLLGENQTCANYNTGSLGEEIGAFLADLLQ